MKIQRLAEILFFFFVFLLSGNKEARSQQIAGDTVSSIIIKAKFVKRTMNEVCGYIHLPEKNMFEITKWGNGEFARKSFEVESYTGCTGSTNFIRGKIYFFSVIKIGDKILYRNIKNEPVQNISVE